MYETPFAPLMFFSIIMNKKCKYIYKQDLK